MLDEIAIALEAIAPETRRRLRRCVPQLRRALATWDGTMPAGGLLLACSTPRNAVVLRADGWPAVAQFDRADAARGLVDAIDADSVEIIIVAAVVVLGERGLAAHAQDVERIVQAGRLPLTVLLVERRGRDIAMVVTTVALEAATVH